MLIDDLGENIQAVGSIWEKSGIKSPGQVVDGSFSDSLRRQLDAGTTASASDGLQSSGMQAQRCNRMPFAAEVEVRRIPYRACDKVEVHVLEGYTLKARLDKEDGNNRVYVEMKDEEGDSRAWLLDGSALRKEGKSAVERIAYEVIEQYGQLR